MRFEPRPNLSMLIYIASIWLDEENQVNDQYWKLEGYIRLDDFNLPTKWDGVSVLKIQTKKPKTTNVATVLVELRSK